jgi:poly-gamma-glutamate capsule biosynthesis protein CapA/YwtB (metallophosphatase superfamily)
MAIVTRKSIIPVLLILTVAIAGTYLLLVRKGPEERGEGDADPQDGTISFGFSDLVPPKLKADLASYFEDQRWIEHSSENGTIEVYKSEEIPPVENALNLYQIWVIAAPFSDYLNQTPITTIGIDPDIDVANPEVEIAEKIRRLYPEVSLETNTTDSRVFLMPLEQLKSEFKVLTDHLDFANSVKTLSNSTSETYPLVSHTVIQGPRELLDQIQTDVISDQYLQDHFLRTSLPSENDFVTIVKTGTTVAGGPGWELCERTRGFSYPIDSVKDVLSNADITIISNEGSLVDGCTQGAGTTSFCGKPSYIQNLLDIGTDIVSLTGNHMCDYGKQAFSETLDTYLANGMAYYGGGKNSAEAWTPLIIETNAGTIAFVGTNLMGPTGVISTETSAGTAYYDEASFTQALASAGEQADIVWVDTQLWPEYGTTPGPDQTAISNLAASLGADIVTGVSSHELQGMTILNDTPVFYGLGNFLFDQMWSQETRQGMVLKILLFEGKIIDTTLMPTILYDYCQPRFAEGQEKDDLLRYFFNISTFTE